ncbi:hypothetical protein DNTS_008661 [Danionella cerebrum]|uniref:Uncharacterized protein n=1 Tax=Danionella cerebrum TaxID=2873325 RepID=A0A553MKG0_9TELE|nr:hypothetical protein DNTS_008661 [Danionella translucida]
MSAQALSSLHAELKRSFAILEASRREWEKCLDECRAYVSSLGNVAVQMKALKQTRIEKTPLSGFPGLPERLQYKLSLAMDELFRKMNENIISRQVSSVFALYERQSQALDIGVCVSRSALAPSIADMLQWLQDAEKYYRLQLLQRRNLLESLTLDDLTVMETAPKRWEDLCSDAQEQKISDALCQVSFFVENE